MKLDDFYIATRLIMFLLQEGEMGGIVNVHFKSWKVDPLALTVSN